MTYHKDKARILARPELLSLTNKFLSEFFELYGQLNGGTRDDGYAFNYNMIECLINSDYMDRKEEIGGLMEMGFVQNTINGFFEHNISESELHNKVSFIIDNYDAQVPDADWYIADLCITTGTTIIEDIDIDILSGKIEATIDRPAILKIEKPTITQTFSLHNNKSGYVGICDVITIDGKDKTINLYCPNKKNLQLSVNVEQAYKIINVKAGEYEKYIQVEPKIMHYSYCSNINGFIEVVDQVYYEIKDNEISVPTDSIS